MKKCICRRNFVSVAAMLLGVALIFTGCGKKTEPEGTGTNGGQEIGSPSQAGTGQGEATKLLKLGQYKGVEVPPMDLEVTEEELQKEIDSVIQSHAYYQEIEGKTVIEEGDVVNIDFKGLLDGEAFEGGSSGEGGYDLEIGSGGFIAGFEEQLVGKELGGFYSLDLEFPDPYLNNPSLAGKPVVFEVTVNKIQERIVPELTDEFASAKLGYDTVEAFQTGTREELEAIKRDEAQSQREYDVLKAVIDNSEYEVSEAEIQAKKDTMIATYEYYASANGMDQATFVMFFMGGMSVEDFEAECLVTSEFNIKSTLAIKAIIEAEGFALTDEEYKSQAEEIMTGYGYDSLEAFEADYTKEEIVENILHNQVVDFLVKECVEKAS